MFRWWGIFMKELGAYFSSLVAYTVIAVFLAITGLFVWVFPQTNVLDYGYAGLDALFTLAPYLYLFLIPAITMKAFAEEKKGGTMEFLLTKPISEWQLLLGKYLAALALVVFALLPTLIYYYTVYDLGAPQGNLDSASVAGSYIGLLLLASVFVAVGIFASSITDSQIVAFIVAVFLCYFLYEGFASVASINVWNEYSLAISKLGVDYHYTSLSRGLLDSRDIVYFMSLSFLMLFFTKVILGSRKW
jgi:ABC-2 type transport system permease protein